MGEDVRIGNLVVNIDQEIPFVTDPNLILDDCTPAVLSFVRTFVNVEIRDFLPLWQVVSHFDQDSIQLIRLGSYSLAPMSHHITAVSDLNWVFL